MPASAPLLTPRVAGRDEREGGKSKTSLFPPSFVSELRLTIRVYVTCSRWWLLVSSDATQSSPL